MEKISKMGLNIENMDEMTLQKFNEAKSELRYNSELLGDYSMSKN